MVAINKSTNAVIVTTDRPGATPEHTASRMPVCIRSGSARRPHPTHQLTTPGQVRSGHPAAGRLAEVYSAGGQYSSLSRCLTAILLLTSVQ